MTSFSTPVSLCGETHAGTVKQEGSIKKCHHYRDQSRVLCSTKIFDFLISPKTTYA